MFRAIQNDASFDSLDSDISLDSVLSLAIVVLRDIYFLFLDFNFNLYI